MAVCFDIAGFSRRLTTVLLSLAVLCAAATTGRASATWPYVEVTQAVQKTGATNVDTATADQFLKAFGSVLITKKLRDFPNYVSAAVTLRKDLAAKIVTTALKIAKLNKKKNDDGWEWANEIVVAAILAAPDLAESIVHAAILVIPQAKDSIVAAATKAAPDHAFFILRAAGEAQTLTFLDPFPFGSINPFKPGPSEPVTSPEQPPGP